jgi:pyruvate dehydrogenase E1 component
MNADDIATLDLIDARLRWLSSWTIHNANHLRDSRDGLKVGGHQASCASMSTIMTALYLTALRPQDKVAVKPHGGPLLHALHYLAGNQSREQLERFRGFGGAQSYPSRTKDKIPVDFSTGSVGLGVAVTLFASLVQDYLIAHGARAEADAGRMIALLGDAELDEGNIYEALIEGYKHSVRNLWWIVDYNRQSLDATTADRMFRRFDDIFETCGWRTVTLKHGRLQRAAFEEPGGERLRDWIDSTPNAEFAALTYQGGSAWRERLLRDAPEVAPILQTRDDAQLAALMTNLGGHCVQTLTDAFAAAQDDVPTLFIAYTIKGFGLPFAGHKDNHAGLMNPGQIAQLRAEMGIVEGDEWEPWAGLGGNARAAAEAIIRSSPLVGEGWVGGARSAKAELASKDSLGAQTRAAPAPTPPHEGEGLAVSVPPISTPLGDRQSTQAAFGRILLDLAKSGHSLADRIVTTSPDVTVSTNLGAWVNQRALFRRREVADVFKEARIPSAQKWAASSAGQHIELGIAEHNLFLMLTALGLSGDLFGERLLPIGTVYDPFIARGLDALNYGCYQDARFMLVATPSGLTLGPEGGAHQSINPPLVALGQPKLRHYEPAFADELALLMQHGFELMQRPDGESLYFRLTTRELDQIERPDDRWQAGAISGGYWLKPPAPDAQAAIVYSGAVAPEALQAWDLLAEDLPGLGLLAITSPDLLHRGWSAREAGRWAGGSEPSHIETLLSALPADAGLVTMLDGAPASLSWLGGVRGQRVVPLGIDRFGQTGDLPDLYREYRLDPDAVVQAMAALFA